MEVERTCFDFGGMGTGLRMEGLWEDEEGRRWRTQLPSCAPDLLNREEEEVRGNRSVPSSPFSTSSG